MQDVQHDIRFAIQQHDVSCYQHVRAVRRWRRQDPHQFRRTGLDALLQARRQRAVASQLFL